MTSTGRSIESLTTARASLDRVLDELLIKGGSQDGDKSRPVESTAARCLKWREKHAGHRAGRGVLHRDSSKFGRFSRCRSSAGSWSLVSLTDTSSPAK